MMIALAAVAAAWVLLPLFRSNDNGPPLERGGAPGAVRDAAHAALRDFELDYATGKINAEDYRFLRPQYEARANGAEIPTPAIRANRPQSPIPATEPNSAQGRAMGENPKGDAGPDAPPTLGGRQI
jgi:hypothetical protein